jgi:hypothetical protein
VADGTGDWFSALPFPLQVTFCDPVIERRPRLQRQKRVFSKRRGGGLHGRAGLGSSGCWD